MRIFDFFTKRKQKHSVSVDAVKEQKNGFSKDDEAEMEKHSQKTMAGVTANAFGRSMTRLGLRRVGHHDTDGYWVLAA